MWCVTANVMSKCGCFFWIHCGLSLIALYLVFATCVYVFVCVFKCQPSTKVDDERLAWQHDRNIIGQLTKIVQMSFSRTFFAVVFLPGCMFPLQFCNKQQQQVGDALPCCSFTAANWLSVRKLKPDGVRLRDVCVVTKW